MCAILKDYLQTELQVARPPGAGDLADRRKQQGKASEQRQKRYEQSVLTEAFLDQAVLTSIMRRSLLMTEIGCKMKIRNSIVVVLAASLIFGTTVDAQTIQPEPWLNWSNVSQLQSGRKVRVETVLPKRKLKGRFVSSDDSGITVKLADGKSESVAKADIRKVVAERESMKYAPLVGAAAGGIVLAVLVGGRERILSLGAKLCSSESEPESVLSGGWASAHWGGAS